MSSPSLKVIIVDDSPEDRETCRRLLLCDPAHRYAIVEQSSLEGALETCRREAPDCILLDYQLHDGNGVEFLHSLRTLGGTRVFPVVMLTGTGSEAIAVEAMKAGAQDYLVKSRLNPEVLHRAVANAIYKAHTDRLLARQQIELEEAYRAVQEASARKDHFLSTLSHELRTPLTPILAAVSTLDATSASSADLREIFSIIQRNIELEARLIDDLLDLTRITDGKLRIEPRLVDVHLILSHALETCRAQTIARGVTLTAACNATAHHVRADAARLQQVFWNLLHNAAKFTPRQGRIEVTTRNPPDAADRVEISVRDTGVGIPAELLPKIFDAFEQGNPHTTRCRHGGLGLGLAIARALVAAHGGAICAESDGENRGATFVVSLATVAGPAPSTETASSRPGAQASSKSAPAPRKKSVPAILIVEDHADTMKMLRLMMRRLGYQVFTASSVAEALTVFQAQPVRVVISDIGLPDGSGAELMARLRQLDPQIIGIALSGYGMEQDLQRSSAAGFAEHLVKPVDWPRLEAAVQRLLAKRSEPTAVATSTAAS